MQDLTFGGDLRPLGKRRFALTNLIELEGLGRIRDKKSEVIEDYHVL